MDKRLQEAIVNDDVDVLHTLLVEDPKLLERQTEEPFPHTPLHVAAATGKTQVAMELATLRPSFARKLNPEGFSPLHLALQHGHFQTARALVTIDPELIRVKGRGRITPLHYVAGREGDEELELLADFLCACKLSIEDITSRCQTVVHIAVKSHNIKAFRVLLGWMKRVYLTEVLDWKDEDGNTVLHIAVSTNQPQVVKLLTEDRPVLFKTRLFLGCMYTDRLVKVNAKNFRGKTALDIFQESGCRGEIRDMLGTARTSIAVSQFLSGKLTLFEKCSRYFGIRDEPTRNMILVVATLIATGTYQAALSPPGGYWQDNSEALANSTSIVRKPHVAGNMILGGSRLYFFTVLNSLAFFTSIGTIWATAIGLLPDTFIVYLAVLILGLTFFVSIIVELPKANGFAGTLIWAFYEILLIAVLLLPILVWFSHKVIHNRMDSTKRRVGNFLGAEPRRH
ncbi:ankyrin repeat-containing protein BDA1-like [Rhodamnia argentea]|uniref:Ankyrin repeat-containing protein BDA1-like n=1 Tax=Rhodamnia argentea TaxID=178133 RepID=A0A8B8NQS4_9MYRT|nr:ankyrin repeat-containing protein BDA1-like [Rhodamnia argentea]